MEKKNDVRYPYTYAADFIRMIPQMGKDGVKLSRSEASQIRRAIAKFTNIDDETLAMKLADAYLGEESTAEELMKKALNYLHKKTEE